MDYFNIHNHTEYSNIYLSADSINKVDKLIDRAKELGLRGIAITDHGVISAHVKALQYYKKRLEEDETWKNFTLGLGEEIYLCENGRSKETAQRGQRYPHCIVVAKDAVGHKQLRQLSSMAWARSYTLFMKRIPSWYSDFETVIGNDKGHLIVTSACIGGIMRNAYDNNSFDEAQKIIDWALEWFGEDFYLELAPAGYEEQISYNKWLIDLSLKTGIKLIMATDSHYLSKEDFKVHEAYLKSKEEERETADFYQYTYLMSQQECRELLSYLPQTLFDEIVKNTKEIADKIEFYDLFTPQIIPHLDDDRCNAIGWAETLAESRINPKYEYINKYKNSEVEDDRYFIYLVLMKLKELHLEKEKLQEYLTRIETECYEYWETSVRLKQPIASYILMVREVERIMWEEANSLVGISRGSAGSTLVNYLCGLTQMNPMEQGIYLPEWRFIHHSKIEIPDVDVDSEASKKDIIRKKLKEKAMRTGGDAVAICTFGTEGSRSAILTACRSIGLTPDEGQFISSLVKQERGFSWSISDCYYGNPDKDREPIKEFQEAIDSHPGLLEIVLGIEGLVGRSGIHACGVNILNHAIYENNALMTAPNGTEITQFDLGDSDYMGGLKMDCLTVEALDKIHICMDLLIKNGLMEWQGSLKSTYNKYLHPDVLERNEPKMWKLIADNKIIDAFQMDSTVAKQTLAMVKPTNIPQLAQLNTLMRLMPEKGQKTPAEEYVEFKNDPLKLKRDIYVLEATDDEKETLYNFMKGYGGVLDSQESAMLAVMLPFTNYDVPHANKIRKIIAKKKLKEVDAAREEYYKIGLENGTSKDILWYIWDVNIKRQMAYSFSLPHTTAYSLICLQEMNLNYFYPAIYWATAVLTVNAGANETNEEIVDIWEKEDNDNEYEDLPDRTGKIKKTTDYAKIASAIGRIKANGYEVELPLINKAQFGFEPDTNNNAILYGLKGISEIGDDIAKDIINKRPYTSVEDFISKCPIQKKQMINLIKAGAFTEFEDRRITMNNFLASVCPKKARITLQNMGTLVDYQLIPKELISYVHLYNFNKYIKKGETPDGFKLDSRAMEFIAKNFPDIDCSSGYLVAKDWKKTYEKQMEGLKNWLKENEELLVKEIQKRDIQEIWDKYCIGNNSAWEMDVLGFYYSPHELSGANIETTKLKDLKDNDYKHQSLLAGTVLGKNVYKHTVTILCPDGVVDLKMTNELFANYNKTISKIINGEKKVLEKSWFTKGTLLSVAGYKMGETFRVKALSRIISIDDLGDIKATKYRYGEG